MWTVDDLSVFERHEGLLSQIAGNEWFAGAEIATGQEYYREVSRVLGLDDVLTFVTEKLR